MNPSKPPGRCSCRACSTRSANRRDGKLGTALVEALKASPARAGLRPETLKPLLTKYGPAVLQSAAPLLASLEADTIKQKAHLETVLAKLPAGNVRRGQALFNGTKGACATCHTIGYLGGKIGPDLTRIGGIRTERDLLESIVFPSASFVRGYEPALIVTRDGRVLNGVPRRDAADEVILVTGASQEIRIPRARSMRCSQAASRSCPPASTSSCRYRNWRTLSPFSRHAANPVYHV